MQRGLNTTARLTQLQPVQGQAHSCRQVRTRCSIAPKAGNRALVGKPAVLQSGLLAAAAAVAVSLAPQPAMALHLTKGGPTEFTQIAQEATFKPELSIPGDSTAQEAAARANPPPFDPVVIGGSAGILLLAFGFSTGRADPQLKISSGKSASSSGGESGRVAEVKDRKKQARAWIGDWQKRTKKST